jgi:uncharacterized protein DUF6659
MSQGSEFEKICNDVITLSTNIRSASVIDKMGKLIAGGMRQGVKSMESTVDSQKLFVEFALRSMMREEFDEQFGRTVYSFSVREKVILASFPLDNHHILRVSIQKDEAHYYEIMESILKLIANINVV